MHVEHLPRPQHAVDERRRAQLVELEAVVRLAAGERVGGGLVGRRRRPVHAPALGAAGLQHEDVLLVRVRRRGGGRAACRHVQVEAVGHAERVERREAQRAEWRDVRARRVDDDGALGHRGLHVDVPHLGVLKRGAARLRDRCHLPAARRVQIWHSAPGVEKVAVDSLAQIVEGEGAGHAGHVVDEERLTRPTTRKVARLGQGTERLIVRHAGRTAVDALCVAESREPARAVRMNVGGLRNLQPWRPRTRR